MAYEIRDNSGSLFPNRKREKDSHPNLTGSVMVAGVEYWISAWTKLDKNGEKWLSLSVKPKEAKEPERKAASQPAAELEDEIPF